MKRRLHVTNSELTTFRTCERRWWFAYRENLRPVRRAHALAVGGIVHDGIAAMYREIQEHQRRGAKPNEAILMSAARRVMEGSLSEHLAHIIEHEEDPDRLRDESERAVTEAEGSVARFVCHFGVHDADRFEVLGVEEPFDVPLLNHHGRATGLRYQGVIDVRLRDRTSGQMVLGEHKTTAQDAGSVESKLDMDPQAEGYLYALNQQYGDPTGHIGRVQYNAIRKRGPRTPDVLKDGVTVSAAAVDTTADIYERALVEQEARGVPRTEKQMARLASLPSYERYVRRHETWVGPAQVERWREEAYATASRVRYARQAPVVISRNAGACNPPWQPPCPYRSICIEDGPELREQRYRVADDTHEEVVAAKAQPEPDKQDDFDDDWMF